MIRNDYDDVRGFVIGDQKVEWILFYNDRQQMTFKHYSDSEDQAVIDAAAKVKELKARNPGVYPDALWELRMIFS